MDTKLTVLMGSITWGSVLGGLAAFFMPIYWWIILVFIMVGMDTISGMVASHKKGIELNSKGYARVFGKLFMYLSIMIGGHVVDIFMSNSDPKNTITYMVTGYVIFREFWSILENADVLLGSNFSSGLKVAIEKIFNSFMPTKK